jgi:DNA-binding CsgD family transcriptional regulator
MTIRSSLRASAALEAIDGLANRRASAQTIVEEIMGRVVSVIDADAFFAGTIDPDTGLGLGAGLGYRLDEEACLPYWQHELLSPDYNQFTALTPAEPVGDLREATGGRLDRSPRYRELIARAGLADELRATMPAGGRRWGDLQLNRRAGAEPFSEDDQAFLRAAAPLAGAALRRTTTSGIGVGENPRGPGVVVLDGAGAVISASPDADWWLAQVDDAWRSYSAERAVSPVLLLLMSLSRLVEAGAPHHRTRLRTADGTWLIAHAAPLGDSGQVALVIQPATGSQTAAIMLDAFILTDREAQVAALVAQGLSTEEIATKLSISQHTVRDHLKAAFEKVGVRSRGELNRLLFAKGRSSAGSRP